MNTVNTLAIVLIIGGILGLMYGSFDYTRGIQEARIGSLDLSVKDTQTVYIQVWESVAAIAVGGILHFAKKKSKTESI